MRFKQGSAAKVVGLLLCQIMITATVLISSYPVVLPARAAIASLSLAIGEQTTYALKSDGAIWAWGDGSLGNASTDQSDVPVQVAGPSGNGYLTGVTAVAAGNSDGYALRSDGTVWAWGDNQFDQLGDGTTMVMNRVPLNFEGMSDVYTYIKGAYSNSEVPLQVYGLTGVTDIAAGEISGYALRSDGTVWAWGYNQFGQLGNGTTTESDVPVQVLGITGITAISAGGFTAYALTSNGSVWTWGMCNNSPTGSDIPVLVPDLTNVTAVAGNGNTAYALKSDGTVWAWGDNQVGELGNGTTTSSDVPVQVSNLTNVTAIAPGCALKSDGTVWDWGTNGEFQLGNGSITRSYVPVQVSNLTNVAAIAPGCALKSDGTVWVWGSDMTGELGSRYYMQSDVPVQVPGLFLGPTTTIATFTIGQSFYTSGGRTVSMDVAPFVYGGRTFIPVRYLADALGAQSTWDGSTQEATVAKGSMTIQLVIGRDILIENGQWFQTDTAPVISQGHAYLPAKYVAEALGYALDWNASTRMVDVLAKA